MDNERPPLDPALTSEIRSGVDIPAAVVGQATAPANHGENWSIRYSHSERPVRIFELFLVVFAAFGVGIWSSIYPLFADAENYEDSHTTYHYGFIILQVVAILALLGYVLCRRGRLDSNPALGTPRGSVLALPFRLAGHLVCSVRQVRIFEWGLILLLTFGYPVIQIASYWLGHVDYALGLSEALARNVYQIPDMLHPAVALSVLGYVLYQRQGSFSDIGLRWNVGVAALALPLFLLGILLNTIQTPMFYWLGQTFGSPGWHPPDIPAMVLGRGEIPVTAIPAGLLNGFFEELIVRAFVMTEVTKLTEKPWLAVVISVAIQISYHFYQGVPMALSHIALFTMFSLFYAKTRSILPVALAHFLVDLNMVWQYGLGKMLL